MKMLKRWLAFFVVIVLLIGVAFNSRGPLIASQEQQKERQIRQQHPQRVNSRYRKVRINNHRR